MTHAIESSLVPLAASPDTSAVGHDVLERALVACLIAFAELARASGQPQRAERLRDAVDVLRDGPLAARGAASAPAGRAATELAGALHGLHALRPRLDSGRGRLALTDREWEVASLIARGLTNRQIAEILVISERTADTHVQNILGKLGLISRAQVAIWFIEHGGHRLETA